MMKIILVVLTILSLATISFSQSTVDPEFTKDYYLNISKNQKTIAWALLGGGTAIAVTGMILGNQEDKPGDLWIRFQLRRRYVAFWWRYCC
jgi:hypothetical protein